MITKELKQQWVDDLRANPDKQGIGTLTKIDTDDVEKDCCWGRLCKLAGLKRKPRGADFAYAFGETEDDLEWRSTLPPWNFLATIGNNPDTIYLDDEETQPLRGRYDNVLTLSGCNDEGFTFPQIADIIDYFLPVATHHTEIVPL